MENNIEEKPKSNKIFNIVLVILLIIGIALLLYFTFKPIKEEPKDYSKYYYFPENYTQMICPDFIGNITNNTFCYTDIMNDSIIVKNGYNYTRYAKERYNE